MIERIWLTKGDNLFNANDEKCDRMLILKINGKIYFTDFSGAYPDAIYYLQWFSKYFYASKFNKTLRWGLYNSDGVVYNIKPITLVKHHHDDLFSKKPFNKAERNADGKLWFEPKEILQILESRSS